MPVKSLVETEVLAALKSNAGIYTSAYDLIVCKLGRSWAHGYRCLDNLEHRGLITCERATPPKPMVIRLVNR